MPIQASGPAPDASKMPTPSLPQNYYESRPLITQIRPPPKVTSQSNQSRDSGPKDEPNPNPSIIQGKNADPANMSNIPKTNSLYEETKTVYEIGRAHV